MSIQKERFIQDLARSSGLSRQDEGTLSERSFFFRKPLTLGNMEHIPAPLESMVTNFY